MKEGIKDGGGVEEEYVGRMAALCACTVIYAHTHRYSWAVKHSILRICSPFLSHAYHSISYCGPCLYVYPSPVCLNSLYQCISVLYPPSESASSSQRVCPINCKLRKSCISSPLLAFVAALLPTLSPPPLLSTLILCLFLLLFLNASTETPVSSCPSSLSSYSLALQLLTSLIFCSSFYQ